MSLNPLTVDILSDAVTEDDGGGEAVTPATIHSGLSVTISYPDKSSVNRFETAGGNTQGPGPLTKSERVVFIDPWDGTVLIERNDRVVPNPAVSWLPSELNVVAVRPYEDGSAGELQLDVEDVG